MLKRSLCMRRPLVPKTSLWSSSQATGSGPPVREYLLPVLHSMSADTHLPSLWQCLGRINIVIVYVYIYIHVETIFLPFLNPTPCLPTSFFYQTTTIIVIAIILTIIAFFP